MIKKKKLIKFITKEISKIDEILSINFVGSFVKKTFFSDIDIVIITKTLSPQIFSSCKSKIRQINLSEFGIQNKKLKINDTFGPLKFNTSKNIVIHLMIYSLKDHIDHVKNSPFTCYDWERFNPTYGKNLQDLFPVNRLFLSDFIFKYRGLKNYRKNLKSKKISYKKYIFSNNKIKIKNLEYKLRREDLFEFSFHIINFLCKNLLKFLNNKNIEFDTNDVTNLLKIICNNGKEFEIIKFYKKLLNFKYRKNKIPKSLDVNKQTLYFLKKYENFLIDLQKQNVKIDFIRHLKTKYNKNIFIGQKIDPNIKKSKKVTRKYHLVFSSNSKRSFQTAKLYSNKIERLKLLNEIDYGLVEGLDINSLKIKYPNIQKLWSKNKDPKFPKGENTKSVKTRLKKFLDFVKDLKLDSTKKYLVVTHNVVMRCLLGSLLKIPMHNWYKISIPYGYKISLILIKGKFFLNSSREKIEYLKKDIYENSISN